jgi:hypothetical protein
MELRGMSSSRRYREERCLRYSFQGYVHRASKDEPQYLIKTDKTDQVAIHKERVVKRDLVVISASLAVRCVSHAKSSREN